MSAGLPDVPRPGQLRPRLRLPDTEGQDIQLLRASPRLPYSNLSDAATTLDPAASKTHEGAQSRKGKPASAAAPFENSF